MSKEMTWADVLARSKEFIGGDIIFVSSRNNTMQFRGPIAGLGRDRDGRIELWVPWYAMQMSGDTKWRYWSNKFTILALEDAHPRDIGNGAVAFAGYCHWFCISIPKSGGSLLSPNEVVGIPTPSERLLSLYGNKILDREVAQKICKDRRFGGILSALNRDIQWHTSIIGEFFSNFSQDIVLEIFLWYYLEATIPEVNERGANNLVY